MGEILTQKAGLQGRHARASGFQEGTAGLHAVSGPLQATLQLKAPAKQGTQTSFVKTFVTSISKEASKDLGTIRTLPDFLTPIL